MEDLIKFLEIQKKFNHCASESIQILGQRVEILQSQIDLLLKRFEKLEKLLLDYNIV